MTDFTSDRRAIAAIRTALRVLAWIIAVATIGVAGGGTIANEGSPSALPAAALALALGSLGFLLAMSLRAVLGVGLAVLEHVGGVDAVADVNPAPLPPGEETSGSGSAEPASLNKRAGPRVVGRDFKAVRPRPLPDINDPLVKSREELRKSYSVADGD
jgi:hypothetical protein